MSQASKWIEVVDGKCPQALMCIHNNKSSSTCLLYCNLGDMHNFVISVNFVYHKITVPAQKSARDQHVARGQVKATHPHKTDSHATLKA